MKFNYLIISFVIFEFKMSHIFYMVFGRNLKIVTISIYNLILKIMTFFCKISP